MNILWRQGLSHDHEYFSRRAAEERALAFSTGQGEEAEVAGQLALAYAALARNHAQTAETEPQAELLED